MAMHETKPNAPRTPTTAPATLAGAGPAFGESTKKNKSEFLFLHFIVKCLLMRINDESTDRSCHWRNQQQQQRKKKAMEMGKWSG
jgi:hypothetical protein